MPEFEIKLREQTPAIDLIYALVEILPSLNRVLPEKKTAEALSDCLALASNGRMIRFGDSVGDEDVLELIPPPGAIGPEGLDPGVPESARR
ncbi:MAG: hypothetical protein M1598_05530 [Actinobacteria bacterium]|nr:hypothetical protein [Actinomycetota bacterium]